MKYLFPTKFEVLFNKEDVGEVDDFRLRYFIDAKTRGLQINQERAGRALILAYMEKFITNQWANPTAEENRFVWGHKTTHALRDALYHRNINVVHTVPGRGPVLMSNALRANVDVRHLVALVSTVETLIENVEDHKICTHYEDIGEPMLVAMVDDYLHNCERALTMDRLISKSDRRGFKMVRIGNDFSITVEDFQCFIVVEGGQILVMYEEATHATVVANYGDEFVYGLPFSHDAGSQQ